MPGIVLVALLMLVAASVLGGYFWARLTEGLPVPEWLRMLTSPIAAGTIVFLLLVAVMGLRFGTSLLTSSDFGFQAESGEWSTREGPLLPFAFKTGFLGGALIGGLPAILGWMLGHRRRRSQS